MNPRSLLVRGFGLVLFCLVAALPDPSSAATKTGASPTPDDTTITLRLPADIIYRHAGKSDSSVVFSHRTHWPTAAGRCTACHPRPYSMLRRGPAPRHREMAAGASCGACHDGRNAFGTRDLAACRTCHSGANRSRLAATAGAARSLPGRTGPPPHVYPPGADSPGKVTFRHATHLKGGVACSACHPKPFAMAGAAPRPGGGMHVKGACGTCHDGRRTFACDAPEACGRCHAGAGS